MNSVGTMGDQDTAVHYRVGRDSNADVARRDDSLRLPFGARGVALVGALALGLFGLLLPTAWLESISFQLYLDRISAAALPPLGMTAHLAAAALLAVVGGLAGWLLGRLFGVQPSDFSLQGLIQRLRGEGSDDEADAPPLRAKDRHPDAPARRPFSAARDIPVSQDQDAMDDYDDDDALLLDSHYVPAEDDDALILPPVGAAAHPGTSFDDVWERLPDPALPDSTISESVLPDAITPAPVVADRIITPQVSAFEPADDEVSMPALSLDDWENADIDAAPLTPPVVQPSFAPSPMAPVMAQPAMMEPVIAPVAAIVPPLDEPLPPRATMRAPLPPVDPLDLSAARLDDLLARLEAGMGRRGGVAPIAPSGDALFSVTGAASESMGRAMPSPIAEHSVPAMPREAVRIAPPGAPLAGVPVTPAPMALGEAGPAPVETPASFGDDPAFPHDPALAAALKTLRRLNQKAHA